MKPVEWRAWTELEQTTPRALDDYGTVAEALETAHREYERIDAGVAEWTARIEERAPSWERNRQWFKQGIVVESSVFLYLHLGSHPEAVERARSIQRTCAGILGADGFNPAPAGLLHATVLTDVVLDDQEVEDEEVTRCLQRYEECIAAMSPCVVFVLGPHLTFGGLILECRVYEPGFFNIRKLARTTRRGDSASPRVPNLEYASLGYLAGGDAGAIARLGDEMTRLRSELRPLAVPATEVYVSKTINKRLVGRPATKRLSVDDADLAVDPGRVDRWLARSRSLARATASLDLELLAESEAHYWRFVRDTLSFRRGQAT